MITKLRKQCVISIPYDVVADCIFPIQSKGFVSFLTCAGVPATANIISVFTEDQRGSFGFLIEDESFDVVTPGCRAPEMPISWERIKLATGE